MVDPILLSNFSELTLNSDNFMSMDGESSRVSRNDYLVEVENDDLDHIPPFNVEAFISNPDLISFLMEPSRNDVDNCSRMLYFDGNGSYAIPPHMQPVSQNIVRIFEILEYWLVEKLFHNHGSMAILEESPQSATDEIMAKLREDTSVLNGLSKALISIRAGHVYSLHMIDNEVVMPQSYVSFAKKFPLFVNVSVNVQRSPSITTRHNIHNSHNTCKVLVISERITTPSTATRVEVTSSADGGIFFL